ncbi:recombinase family protein [Octadecabacter ascidiaceicola]|uniref:DNA-invertase hin n=1 Tax=Octadecabacter ascidiaceicola TaxID=1655543 RepID=A0A238KSD3_9RHOB|nr:recombinase family protein [Octadecabacter ascidiaceicola]SMX45607.1 DNA-invertase hin [Octadecabacter ascidiaceicola]
MNQHTPASKFVAYYRVSTTGQGESGLGLEAQRMAVQAYLATNPTAELVAEFTEIESGKKKNRPELAEAVKNCKREKATLVIAKLDRLARNVHFVSGLMETNINFVACDNPHANRLMVHMLAAFAEHEREMISQRTKDGLAAAKARGVELGRAGKDRAKENRQAADDFAKFTAEQIRQIPEDLRTTITSLTRELNARKVPTARNGVWDRQRVYRLLRRVNEMGEII